MTGPAMVSAALFAAAALQPEGTYPVYCDIEEIVTTMIVVGDEEGTAPARGPRPASRMELCVAADPAFPYLGEGDCGANLCEMEGIDCTIRWDGIAVNFADRVYYAIDRYTGEITETIVGRDGAVRLDGFCTREEGAL